MAKKKSYGRLRARAVMTAYRRVFPDGKKRKLREKAKVLMDFYGLSNNSKDTSVSDLDVVYSYVISHNPSKDNENKKKIKKNFYLSWEWKSARYEALKRYGRKCMCCGWAPGVGGKNYLCVDHIKPIRIYPELALDQDNLQVLCNDCNMGKSSRHEDDFRRDE